MPVIRVVSRKGRPPVTPLQASFGPGTGTVGRSLDCTLALPDENRHISRRQARVDVEGGVASITCLGSGNSLIINGHELRQGETRPLQHGDRLHIADYELRFEETAGSAKPWEANAGLMEDPFALPDFESDFPSPADASHSPGRLRSERLRDDAFGGASPGLAMIPEGFDPFGEPPAEPHRSGDASGAGIEKDPLGMGLHADPMAEVAAGRTDSIDSLFDLKPGSDPLGPDSPLGRPFGEKPPARDTRAADRAGDPIPDNAPVLSSSFRLPQSDTPGEFGVPDDPAPFGSRNDPRFEPGVAPLDMPEVTPFGMAKGKPHLTREQRPPSRTHGAFVGSPEVPGDEDAPHLLRALLLGLGMAALPRGTREDAAVPALTPELMQRVGEILAIACDGTVELLQARTTLKQEFRADVTMIQAQDNNALKFAPDGHSALAQLLAPKPVRGFMAPRDAMRDAYDDLLAHQIGFIAGMRAAMQGLVGRFDPQVLEKRLEGKSLLGSMVPAARKARLWELFSSLYGEVAREAEDDFQRLFGRAFVEAYEAQVARLKARDGGDSQSRG